MFRDLLGLGLALVVFGQFADSFFSSHPRRILLFCFLTHRFFLPLLPPLQASRSCSCFSFRKAASAQS